MAAPSTSSGSRTGLGDGGAYFALVIPAAPRPANVSAALFVAEGAVMMTLDLACGRDVSTKLPPGLADLIPADDRIRYVFSN